MIRRIHSPAPLIDRFDLRQLVLQYLNRTAFFTQWAILAVALLTLGGATGFNLYLERARTESREQNRLLTQARVIQENLEQNLTAVSRVLADLRKDAPQGKASPGLGERLKLLTDAMPGIRTLLLLDAVGTVSASTRPELEGKNFAYRDYFKMARRSPDPDILFVSAPFQTTLGVYGVNVARTIPGSQGEFAGIVVATLDPEYFRTLMTSVLYAPDMWVAMAHGDGLQVAMVPEREGQVGKNLAQPGSFFTRHRDSGKESNVLTGIVYATGEERMMALRSIQPTKLRQDKPLVVAVGRDLNVVYAAWRRDLEIQGGLFGLIALGATLGLYAYRRRQREFALKKAEIVEALAQSEWKLKTIIETEPECVKVLAADGTLLQMNRAGLQMIEAASDTQVVGHKMTELVTPEFRDAFDSLNKRVNQGESGTLEFEIVGLKGTHRWLDTHAVPMRDVKGQITGLLAVTRDITARKRVDQELKRLAQIDSLTNLANRRHFMELAEQELSRTLRYGGPLSVLMLDLDHFKNINDTYGHKIGDLVLQKFGGLVRQTLRDVDAVGRVGGEEFAVVLPQTDGEHALEVAERLCRLTADTAVALDQGRPLHFTVSIGLTTLAGANSNIDTLLGQADQALYEAKNSGRNRVCAYPRQDGAALHSHEP